MTENTCPDPERRADGHSPQYDNAGFCDICGYWEMQHDRGGEAR